MDSLLVPFGVAPDGGLVDVASADKRVIYRCPACDDRLILRDGEIRVKNFAHRADTQCSAESIWHKTAKRLLVNAIQLNARGEGARITLNCECDSCHSIDTVNIPPRYFSDAIEEHPVDDYKCDVVGFRADVEALAIEVLYTNPMSSEKRQRLRLPWIELSAIAVVEAACHWIPLTARLDNHKCRSCVAASKTVTEVADQFGIERALYSVDHNNRTAKYVADAETCFKCKQRVPVFWWRGVPFCQTPPPEPRPKTIKYKHSKQYGGSYWANTCANCGMLQGDNHLFVFEDGALADMPKAKLPDDTRMRDDSPIAEFKRVIRRNFGA